MARVATMKQKLIATLVLGAAAACALPPPAARAEPATEIQMTYSNGQFEPKEVTAPANKPLVIRLKNLDAKAIEFESKTLKAEKVVAAKGEAVINIRAQKPGRYEFFDEFNEKARGAVNVQ